MLRRIDNKTVGGSGFQVVVIDIHAVTYKEGPRQAWVEIEGGMESGKIDWLVYTSTLSMWHVGNTEQAMTDEERAMVLERISAALKLLDMPHRLA